MATVRLSHDYRAPARAVWRVCTDYDALAQVCAPLLSFDGLPAGRVQNGQDITVGVRLFGVLPRQDYRMQVVACDDVSMAFRSEESGAGVRRWAHSLRVEPRGTYEARLIERIDIEAGLMTPVFAAWARKLYGHRHTGRQRLLRSEVLST